MRTPSQPPDSTLRQQDTLPTRLPHKQARSSIGPNCQPSIKSWSDLNLERRLDCNDWGSTSGRFLTAGFGSDVPQAPVTADAAISAPAPSNAGPCVARSKN